MRTELVDISPMVDPYLNASAVTDKVRAGNVMARERMIVLYDISQRDNALVLGTSNKTELLSATERCSGIWLPRSIRLAICKDPDLAAGQASGPPERVATKPSADSGQGRRTERWGSRTPMTGCCSMIDERRTDEDSSGPDLPGHSYSGYTPW
jgi:NAD+ synthase